MVVTLSSFSLLSGRAEWHGIIGQVLLDKFAIMHDKCASSVRAFYYWYAGYSVQLISNFIILNEFSLFVNNLLFSGESFFSHKFEC